MSEIELNDYGKWTLQGEELAKKEENVRWELADWLASGEKYGRSAYHFANRIFPEYKTKTLQDWAYVARHVESSIRNRSLSFAHHQLVAGMLPAEQVKYLTWAEQQKASVSTLRGRINAERSAAAGSSLLSGVPHELRDKLKLLSEATGLSDAALIEIALTDLVAKSGEAIKKAENVRAEEMRVKMEKAAEFERRRAAQAKRIREWEKSQEKAAEDWKIDARQKQDAYIAEHITEAKAAYQAAAARVNQRVKETQPEARAALQAAYETTYAELERATMLRRGEAERLFPTVMPKAQRAPEPSMFEEVTTQGVETVHPSHQPLIVAS
jgi:hypothetical protein